MNSLSSFLRVNRIILDACGCPNERRRTRKAWRMRWARQAAPWRLWLMACSGLLATSRLTFVAVDVRSVGFRSLNWKTCRRQAGGGYHSSFSDLSPFRRQSVPFSAAASPLSSFNYCLCHRSWMRSLIFDSQKKSSDSNSDAASMPLSNDTMVYVGGEKVSHAAPTLPRMAAMLLPISLAVLALRLGF